MRCTRVRSRPLRDPRTFGINDEYNHKINFHRPAVFYLRFDTRVNACLLFKNVRCNGKRCAAVETINTYTHRRPDRKNGTLYYRILTLFFVHTFAFTTFYIQRKGKIYFVGGDYRVKQLQCNRSTFKVNAVRVPYHRDILNRLQRNFTDHDHGIIIEYRVFVIIVFTFEEIISFGIYLLSSFHFYNRFLFIFNEHNKTLKKFRSLHRIGRVWVVRSLRR
ncbi:hypothetical protein AGLY_004830 [Aphis glycines]|uniref:Uncharacterized protein n=1 Tax=Aphis glycines TaxID=307491 RepID=A0A6G0TV07_APHGL|nr:hypothetical protein AGLY_004830 [Aphis glycines]